MVGLLLASCGYASARAIEGVQGTERAAALQRAPRDVISHPFWAGSYAAIACQPQIGASLRKGWFRMIGMVVGVFPNRSCSKRVQSRFCSRKMLREPPEHHREVKERLHVARCIGDGRCKPVLSRPQAENELM
jgi:Fusaric acid resistance protein-like